MRILHIVPTYHPATRYGGPIYSVHSLCKALVASGNEIHVFTTNVDGNGESNVALSTPIDMDGVNVWYFRSNISRRLYWSTGMRKALQERVGDFDLLHLHSVFLWPTSAAGRVAWNAGIPYVISPRGMLVKGLIRKKNAIVKTAWIGLVERRNIECANAIHATSTLEERELRKFGFRFPTFVKVPNGVSIENGVDITSGHITEGQRPVPEEPLILFIGRINWKKGLEQLIKAMDRIRAGVLVIAGNDEEGYQLHLQRLVTRLNLSTRVKFLGFVGGVEKLALLRRAQLLVLSSCNENFGNVVLEAMAQGKAVVVTRGVGAAEIVESEGAGIVSEIDPESLAESIRCLIEDPALAARMGARGKAAIRERYTWEIIASRMEGVYREVVSN
ncbi:MAG: glycosyltransferase [Gammaproteobacteria bacterium]|nr:glycosyltransferase [Gammaproteobacteria bacterium]